MAIILASIHLFGVRFQVKTNLKCVPALFLFSKYTELHFFSTTFLLPQPAILQFFFQSIKINLNESVFTTWFLLLSVSLISQLNCRLNVNWICFNRSRLIVRSSGLNKVQIGSKLFNIFEFSQKDFLKILMAYLMYRLSWII